MNKIVSGMCAALLALGAQFTHAGIIDTTNNSYIDTDTGLEWMDFGINNNRSHNQVVAELGTTWAGWSLATEAQVLQLWHNAFSGKGSDIDAESATGSVYTNYVYANYSDYTTAQSVHEATFDVMGCNVSHSTLCLSRGWFANTTGSLSYVSFIDYNNSDDYVDAVGLNVDYNFYYSVAKVDFSTMLVKTQSAAVPEASSLALFALGLLGLGFARRRQQH